MCICVILEERNRRKYRHMCIEFCKGSIWIQLFSLYVYLLNGTLVWDSLCWNLKLYFTPKSWHQTDQFPVEMPPIPSLGPIYHPSLSALPSSLWLILSPLCSRKSFQNQNNFCSKTKCRSHKKPSGIYLSMYLWIWMWDRFVLICEKPTQVLIRCKFQGNHLTHPCLQFSVCKMEKQW